MKKLLKTAALILLALAALPAFGCERETVADWSQEKVAYISGSGETGRIMVTAESGGAEHELLRWQGSGENLAFSNDGKYFTVIMTGGARQHTLVISTDGTSALAIPMEGVQQASFSPDSSRVAFVTAPAAVSGSNLLEVADIATGTTRVLVSGNMLCGLVWADDDTIVYGNSGDGLAYRVSEPTGEKQPLSMPDRRFRLEPLPVSYRQHKIALVEDKEFSNIWSLDLDTGSTVQVTNNTFSHETAGYLPESDRIIFSETYGPKNLCVMADDGLVFHMLTDNSDIDKTPAVSLKSGKITYIHERQFIKVFPKSYNGSLLNLSRLPSIWLMNGDGADSKKVVDDSDGVSLANPVFAPVSEWSEPSPVSFRISGNATAGGAPASMEITNSSGGEREVTLNIIKMKGYDQQNANLLSGETGLYQHGGDMKGTLVHSSKLSLSSGESLEIGLPQELAIDRDNGRAGSLLFSLSTPGSPPVMLWCEVDKCLD